MQTQVFKIFKWLRVTSLLTDHVSDSGLRDYGDDKLTKSEWVTNKVQLTKYS